MKNLSLPSNCTVIESPDQNCIYGGCGFISDSVYAVAKFIFPAEKIAGESRSGYYPTFILIPEAVFLDYAALRMSNLLFKAASRLEKAGF